MVKSLSRDCVLENQTKLNIEDFAITSFPDRFGDDCFHFQVEIPNSDIKGFGTDFDEKKALKIAFSECIERQMYSDFKDSLRVKTTSGFAVHMSPEEAKESSICEALERDSLLSHWLLKIEPVWLDKQDFSSTVQNHIYFFNGLNLNIKLGVLSLSNSRHCVVGCYSGSLEGSELGYSFSSSCSKDINSAAMGIIKELRRSLNVVKNKIDKKMPVWDENLTTIDGHYHFNYYMNPENMSKLDWFLQSKNQDLKQYNFDLETVELMPKVLPPWKLYGAHTSSQQLQDFYFGHAKFRRLNRNRLKLNWQIQNKLNKNLHFLA